MLLRARRRCARAAGGLALLSLLGACPAGDGDACEIPPGAPLELVVADETGEVRSLVDGAAVPLLPAPQGGHIALVAPRVRGPAAPCRVQASAAVREPGSERVIGLEERPLRLVPGADGAVAPGSPARISELVNVPLCPSAVTTEIDGRALRLEVRILDGSNGPVVTEIAAAIRPRCADDLCRRDCSGSPATALAR